VAYIEEFNVDSVYVDCDPEVKYRLRPGAQQLSGVDVQFECIQWQTYFTD